MEEPRESINADREVQIERQILMRKYCKKGETYFDQKNALRRMYTTIYSDNYSAIYCAVPKAACSNWKRIFMAFERIIEKPTYIAPDKVHGWFYKLIQKS